MGTDQGGGAIGVNLAPHVSGNPLDNAVPGTANVTVGHTWVIIVGALALLWLLGGGVFRSIRM